MVRASVVSKRLKTWVVVAAGWDRTELAVSVMFVA
jgi:hypothetical protein